MRLLSITVSIALLAALAWLTGCGMKGPLFLPPRPSIAPAPAAAIPADSAQSSAESTGESAPEGDSSWAPADASSALPDAAQPDNHNSPPADNRPPVGGAH